MAAEEIADLVCFAGPLDGKIMSNVRKAVVPDGHGAVYRRERFKCGNKWKEILIHESVEFEKLDNETICRAIKDAEQRM